MTEKLCHGMQIGFQPALGKLEKDASGLGLGGKRGAESVLDVASHHREAPMQPLPRSRESAKSEEHRCRGACIGPAVETSKAA